MQEIITWLNSNKDFEKGKILYKNFGSSSFFKELLDSGPTPYNIKKLSAELSNLASALPKTTSHIVAKKHDVPSISNKDISFKEVRSDSDHSNDFAKYLELKELLKATYRQLERNMAELDLIHKEPLLHLTAKNIISLHQKIQDIYKLIDHFDSEGVLPKTRAITVTRAPKEEIQLLRQSNSKAKTRLKEGCRDRTATEKLIQDNNSRIIELGGKVKA